MKKTPSAIHQYHWGFLKGHLNVNKPGLATLIFDHFNNYWTTISKYGKLYI